MDCELKKKMIKCAGCPKLEGSASTSKTGLELKKNNNQKKNKRKNPTKKTTAYKIKKQGKKRKDTVGIHARIHTEE